MEVKVHIPTILDKIVRVEIGDDWQLYDSLKVKG